MKIITWQATYDGSNMTAQVDLCQMHSDMPGYSMPDPLPVPVSVSHGLHNGTCQECALGPRARRAFALRDSGRIIERTKGVR